MTLTLRPAWSAAGEPLRKTWRGQVTIDSARWLTRKDVLDAIAMAHHELGATEVRTVGMLDDDMRVFGNDPTRFGKDAQKRPNFQLLDTCFDQLLEIGVRPVVGTNFMPTALARQPSPAFSHHWWCKPPADLQEWSSFITLLAQHLVDRYGREEVVQWTFEVWNEPNLLGCFWLGTIDEWYDLWAATWTALKRVDERLIVAGPSTARGEWLTDFVARTRAAGCPADRIITHIYNNDSAFGALSPFDGPQEGKTNSAPDFALRVIRGVHRDLRAAGFTGEIHWNEYGRSWFPCDRPRETAQEAAWIAMTLAGASQFGDRFAYWCLSDVFDQSGYGAEAFHGCYGLLSLQRLRKPAYQAFRLLDKLGDRTLPVTVEGGSVTTNAWVTRSTTTAQVLIHAVAPQEPWTDGTVTVEVDLPPGARPAQAVLWRIGTRENNILADWQDLGAPAILSHAQTADLRARNHLTPAPAGALTISDGRARFTLDLPGLAVLEIPIVGGAS